MSIGSDLKSSLTGNIETALLVIHDYRDTAAMLEKRKVNQKDILGAMQDARSMMTAARLSN